MLPSCQAAVPGPHHRSDRRSRGRLRRKALQNSGPFEKVTLVWDRGNGKLEKSRQSCLPRTEVRARGVPGSHALEVSPVSRSMVEPAQRTVAIVVTECHLRRRGPKTRLRRDRHPFLHGGTRRHSGPRRRQQALRGRYRLRSPTCWFADDRAAVGAGGLSRPFCGDGGVCATSPAGMSSR